MRYVDQVRLQVDGVFADCIHLQAQYAVTEQLVNVRLYVFRNCKQCRDRLQTHGSERSDKACCDAETY